MSKSNREEIEILIYDKYPFEPISYPSPLGKKEYPPTKYIVPKPKFEPDTSFEDYWEYYRPFVLEFFMKKFTEALEKTGSLDEVKDKRHKGFYFIIEAKIEDLYDEEFSYDFTIEAEELIKKYI